MAVYNGGGFCYVTVCHNFNFCIRLHCKMCSRWSPLVMVSETW